MTNNLPEPFLTTLGVKSKAELAKKIRAGAVSLSDVAAALLPATPAEVVSVAPAPLPVALTPKQRDALDKVVEVFGSVVPSERRRLDPNEIAALLEERETLDTVLKMAKDRKDNGIRETILNHIDVEFEEEFGDRVTGIPQDKDGHLLNTARVPVPDTDQCFSWEISDTAPTIDVSILKEMVEVGELDNATYLKMTTQVRVVDEYKVLTLLARDPSLLPLLAKAAVGGTKKGSLYVRKQK